MGSGSSVTVRFCFLAVTDLISLIRKVYKPTQEKPSYQGKKPIFSYIVKNICDHA
jgi:hypothetical protein